jgi:transcriptional regulator with GAF, ATPase, and Fis domain
MFTIRKATHSTIFSVSKPGHACLVAPLRAGDTTLGILTLDRSVCSPYADGTVQLVQMYAGLLGLAIDRAAKAAELERLKGHAEARAEWLRTRSGAEARPRNTAARESRPASGDTSAPVRSRPPRRRC